jgi:hypothetical protein
VRIPADEPPPQPVQPAEDDLDLDREIEYAFDTDEPMLGRPPSWGRRVRPHPEFNERSVRGPSSLILSDLVCSEVFPILN